MCGPNTTTAPKQRLAGIALFDAGESTCKFCGRKAKAGGLLLLIGVKLTMKFENRVVDTQGDGVGSQNHTHFYA
jgi:hypothetical protein